MENNQNAQQNTNLLTQREANPSLLKRQMFPGRLNRANYALGYFGLILLVAIFVYIFFYVDSLVDHRSYQQLQKDATDTTRTVLNFFLILPIPAFFLIGFTSLTTRRMHDLDRESSLWIIWNNWYNDFLLKKGTEGPNKYGEPQKGIGIRHILGLK